MRPILFWLLALAAFLGCLWLLSGVLTPFVLGIATAYLLDPLVDRLERLRVPRWAGALLALLAFAALAAGAVLLLVPLFQVQATLLIDAAPRIVDTVRREAMAWLDVLAEELRPEDLERLRGAAAQYAGDLAVYAGGLIRALLGRGFAVLDLVSVAIIAPVVAFYLLRDWDELIRRIDGWLPRPHADTVRAQMREVDRTLAGFLRGQGAVCLILGGFYAAALTLAGLDFGLTVGLLAGVLTIVPYVGSAVGFLASVSLALVQFDDWWRVGLVAAIFVAGQTVEGYVLTPRLVGGSVGLHPVWVMFALLAGGYLFGFLGVLVAVPAAAVIGVGARFALSRYLDSPYYRGGGPAP